jgi:hypothetical protein
MLRLSEAVFFCLDVLPGILVIPAENLWSSGNPTAIQSKVNNLIIGEKILLLGVRDQSIPFVFNQFTDNKGGEKYYSNLPVFLAKLSPQQIKEIGGKK